ncbi:Eukaryotic translation initiation factor eIF-1 [Dimargaris cristalligena]|uniref:Translation initiation factor eIF1 n=1 Tax=Dimargaris cristalligena TaxID=215637 RepID=A0A4P9ZP29_9FUNG|nr:Eukaryotic translation initiation factor eIF-1 [Dimargaris cristalligena]RKP35047.1 translation initiation factor eIF1 [Dimargaris cristalligena]|eukprot:RKP35047.1 translation initiation factor eIF1 [Dimargaris cristalligena]
MSNIQNFETYDPFADIGEENVTKQPDNIHIRIQQRNGRKTITTIQGLNKELDMKKLLKAFKKIFACNGSIIKDEEHGEIIQLQGDQRNGSAEFLVSEGITKKELVKIHGF